MKKEQIPIRLENYKNVSIAKFDNRRCIVEDLDNEDNAAFEKMLEDSKKNEEKELLITIESWGQIKAKEIFTSAIDALNEELKAFLKQIK